MCGLCDKNPKIRAAEVERMEYISDRLESLAASIRAMSRGNIEPHSGDAKKTSAAAKHVIRELVVDWL